MPIIQVVLETKLLNAVNAAATRQKLSRSALIRDALRAHLRQRYELQMEESDRRGYLAKPQRQEEFDVWQDAATWPRV